MPLIVVFYRGDLGCFCVMIKTSMVMFGDEFKIRVILAQRYSFLRFCFLLVLIYNKIGIMSHNNLYLF